MNQSATFNRSAWLYVGCAAVIISVTMGFRQSLGLFVSPLHADTGSSIAQISFALAINQFFWGLVQPFAGAAADRYGADRVLIAGSLILAISVILVPTLNSGIGLIISLGILTSIGTGIGSFSVIFGAVAQRIPQNFHGKASGIINAGSSFGQFIFAPIIQRLIAGFGWINAFYVMAMIVLATIPFSHRLRTTPSKASTTELSPTTADSTVTEIGLRQQIRQAMADRSYLLLHAGFFTCGFHIAFLVTHLPGEVQLCGLSTSVASWSLAIIGLSNIFGSIFIGLCINKYRSKYLLFYMYGSRAIMIALYMAAPKTALTFYIFAIGLGLTWLATIPPTAALVGKLFGTRHIGTLFGLTLVSHQTGGFLGAWLGGLAITHFGGYQWMWWADAALALTAAFINLPIRETRIEHNLAPT